MLKRQVLQAWEDRAIAAQAKIDEEIMPELERLRYEMEIAQRLLAKAQDDTARETWQVQVDVLQMRIVQAKDDLCEAMIAEIEVDMAADRPAERHWLDKLSGLIYNRVQSMDVT